MGRGPQTLAFEITKQAEDVLGRLEGKPDLAVLIEAVDELLSDYEPDGVTRFMATVESGYSGCMVKNVPRWQIVYRVTAGTWLIVTAIDPHFPELPKPSRSRR